MPAMTTILRAVRESDLSANQRLVALVVASLGDTRTGEIPEQFRPSLLDLAEMTGLSRATLYRCARLADGFGGWLVWEPGPLASARVLAAGIPSQIETPDDLEPSQIETDLSQSETDPSQIEIRTFLYGTSEQLPEHTVAPTADESLFSVEPIAAKDKPKPVDDLDFTAFWAAYPRKTDKGHGRTAWHAAIKKGADPLAIISGAERYAAHVAAARTESRFVPHPATWLNGERWDDQLPAIAPANGHQPYRNPADASAYLGDL